MNPENPSRPEIEAKITALLLGELPEEEARLLRYTISQDAGLQKLHDRLQLTIGLVREVQAKPAGTAPLKLSDERRKKLFAHFKTPRQPEVPLVKPMKFSYSRVVTALAVVAILALVAKTIIPNFVKARSTSPQAALQNRLQMLAAQKQFGERDNLTPTQPPQPNGAVATGGVYTQNVVGYVNIPAESGSESIVASAPAPAMAAPAAIPPAPVIVLPNASPTESVEPTQYPAREAITTTLAMNAQGNASSAPAQSEQYQASVRTSVSPDFGVDQRRMVGQVDKHGETDSVDLQQAIQQATNGAGESPAASTFAFNDGNGSGPAGGYSDKEDRKRDSSAAKAIAGGGAVVGTVNARGRFGGGGFGGGNRGSSGGGGAGGTDNFAVNNPSSDISGDQPISGYTGNTKNAGELGADKKSTEIKPGTSAITLEPGRMVFTDPNTGLPVTVPLTQNSASTPLGQFPGQSSNYFALDDTTKTPADISSREGFYRLTNGVPVLGDVPMAGRLMESPAGSSQFAAGTTRADTGELRYTFESGQTNFATVYVTADSQAKKVDLAQLQETHKLLYSKIKAESIDAAIPHTSMDRVVEVAQPATNRSLWQKITGEYASTTRLQVQNDGGIIQGFGSPAAATYSYDPYFVQTTFEAIQSQVVLSNAIARLDLNNTWGKKFNGGQPLTTSQTMQMLKGHLSLTPVKNTKLINVTVTEDDPKEAAVLANTIAESYIQFRFNQRDQIVENGLAALQQSYLEESNRIQALQAEMGRLKPSAKPQQPDAPLPQPPPDAPIPQPEIQVKANAFSTFSLNVSDVSFQLAAASLEKGHLPPAAGIRSEEFINAFDYRDPEPDDSQRIAFKWERAHDPFAHNRDFLRFSLKTAATGRMPGRPLNLVLLLDDSGSMERADRVAIIREALRILATQLQPQDTLSIVTFARTAHLWADGVPGDQAGAVLDKVSGLTPEGGTNLEEAMRLAYETARRHYFANGMNRVVLITDGAANLGDVDAKDLKAKVETNRKQGIALDCFGIGWEDFNDNLLEQLSSQGDGRYAFLNTPDDAHNNFATKLAGALQIAASGVKVQVEFNPQRTISYRQIGYATHQLTKQQFRDNTIAAGEIAAAEAGNALYTVETDPAGDGPIATVRVRYQIPGTTDYREQSWDVPYTGHAPMLEQASPAMRLSATAASFSEWLSSSPFAGEVTPDQLLNYLNGVPAVYSPDERPKKLEWMIRQAKSIAAER